MKGKDLLVKYREVWDEYANTSVNQSTYKSKEKLLDRGFVFEFDEGSKDIDILFVGINPSYVKNDPGEKFYSKEEVKDLSYFKPFNIIMDKLKKSRINISLSWSHLDMLVFRETQQSIIKNRLLKSEDGNQFIFKQLLVSKQILEYLNPKVMVVSNTLARHFLGRDKYKNTKGEEFGVWMGYDFEFDNVLGTDKIVNNSKVSPHVFFTSMLSGQRALDKGSRERLIWHIGNVLDKRKKL